MSEAIQLFKNSDTEGQRFFVNQAYEECKKLPLNIVLLIYAELTRLRAWYHFDIKFHYMPEIDYRLNYNETKLIVTYNPITILRLLHDVTICQDCNRELINECVKDDECYFCNNFKNYKIYSD